MMRLSGAVAFVALMAATKCCRKQCVLIRFTPPTSKNESNARAPSYGSTTVR